MQHKSVGLEGMALYTEAVPPIVCLIYEMFFIPSPITDPFECTLIMIWQHEARLELAKGNNLREHLHTPFVNPEDEHACVETVLVFCGEKVDVVKFRRRKEEVPRDGCVE